VAAVPSGPNWTPPPTIPIKKNNKPEVLTQLRVLEVRFHVQKVYKPDVALYFGVLPRAGPFVLCMLNLHRINVLTKLLGIISVDFDVTDQLLFRFLRSSDIGEKMRVQADSTTAVPRLQESL
jgi:hypothetical protein